MEIRRGTTPTITIELPEEIQTAGIRAAYVTIGQGESIIEKDIEDLTAEEGNVYTFVLTQEETLSLSSVVKAWIQIRAKVGQTAMASQKEIIKILPLLKEGEI